MKTKEQLLEELNEWTAKYVEACERAKSVSPVQVLSGKEDQITVTTKESLNEFKRALEKVDTISTRLQEIIEELSQLR